MDIGTNISHLNTGYIVRRGALFFGWMGAFLCSMATIGLIPTVPIFIISFMRIEAREPWKIVLPMASIMTVFIYLLFDQLLAIPWPQTILGNLDPVLKNYVPSI
jgi:hypothetical protein